MAAFGSSKVISSKNTPAVEGGGASFSGGGGDSGEDRSNSGSGPTGSSRSYPKGGSKPGDTQSAPFNPQKVAATDIYVGGV